MTLPLGVDVHGPAATPLGRMGAGALGLALAGGALQALAFAGAPAGPWPGWQVPGGTWLPGLLQVLGVVLLLGGLPVTASPRRAAIAGWLFGVAWLVGSVWWLFISMHRYGGLPAWLAAAAVAALAGALALYLAVATGLYQRWRRGPAWHDVPLFAALWLLAELARGRLLTGFPWSAAGYSHVDSLLAAWAPLIGVYGIGTVSAGVAALAVRAWSAPGAARWGCIGAAGLLGVAPYLLPPAHSGTAGSLSVTLLQGNVPQDEKFDPARLPATMNWHLRALLRAEGDLVLAAETALPLLPDQMPDGLWDDLQQSFARRPTRALFGVPLGDYDTGYTNSAVGLGDGQPLYRYDKHHLVPFGEFIPLGFRWFVDMMNIPLGDFNRGPLVAPSMPVHGQRVAPNICYEDLFGEELAARFADPDHAPTMFANLSNIGWFGRSVAVSQHLQISRMRSLEFQRPMLRATNTGATVVIDHQGIVTAALAPFAEGVLQARVEGRVGITPFAWWAGRWGVVPLWLLSLAVIGLAGLRARRASSR